MFRLEEVSKKFERGGDKIDVIDQLNLDIADQEFISIMGPSGSGKSTMLNLLGGITRPTSGRLLFRDQPIHNMREAQLSRWRSNHIGFIFQFYNLMPQLNAQQNVELPLLLTNLGKKARAAHVAAALELVGLQDRASHLPRELSGGQQQRVAIARAVVADPDVLLCDEPTGDLDRKTADDILNILNLLNEKMKKTVIMVTHDPAAAKYGKRQLHFDKGIMEQS